ncbi:MAG: endo-1,4-beta-xylanase [Candidatus Staskawiczbacteria bacterium]|nr:endo-1,4-beta-xylanase [Candidatus Staskawiczbacteria bacterium]
MKKIFKIVLFILAGVIIFGVSVFGFFFVGKAQVNNNITWGVDFSQMQAESLDLDWKETYSAIIKDLKVKNIKLHTQWDFVEDSKNNYYFNDIDWQLSLAKENGVNVIYVVGMKSGRWPECHIPDWAEGLSKQKQQEEILNYIKKTVLRYKDNSAIINWQVENEPLFRFGECPWYDKDFLKKEVELVRSLDPSRKIIISDSGEQSSWFQSAKIGDIVGITMYRKVWAHITDNFGFNVNFFFSPVTYWRKALLVKKIFGKEVIVIELQAEPWASKLFYDIPLSEQEKTMNLELFKQNVEYAKETGLDKFYFWGVEWWYWMKSVQNQPEIWNEAKNLFN